MTKDDFSVHHTSSIDAKIHKPPINPSAATPASSLLNPRSCVTCRRRKVKCDKKHPCSNCTRQGIECVFPAPGRAPRKPKKPADGELADRLRRLESLVSSLGTRVRAEDSQSPLAGSEESAAVLSSSSPPPPLPLGLASRAETYDQQVARVKREINETMNWKGKTETAPEESHSSDPNALTSRFGKLIIHNARSRYISPGLWACLKAELDDIKTDKDLLELSEDEEDYNEHPSPSTSSNTNLPTFIFNLSSANVDMLLLHPPPDQIPILWEIYKDRVETLMHIQHVPVREPIILDAAKHLNDLDRPVECSLFAIYYGAVTSLKEDECKDRFGESRSDLMTKYRFGLEQALSRANFLQSDSVHVLQAFLMFLICLRPNENARVVWSLTALAVKIAQGSGLHRDGDHYPNLTIFQKEMRRRVWWHTCILDMRAAEELGSDHPNYDFLSDTKMPLNVNDSDFSPDSTELPKSRIGMTDMTLSIIRFEISKVLKFMTISPAIMSTSSKVSPEQITFQERKEKLEELEEKLESTYLKGIDYNIPYQYIVGSCTRLILSKMRMTLYVQYQKLNGSQSLSQKEKDFLFKAAIDGLEISISHETQPRLRKYSWLIKTYTQWHAIAYCLRELCIRTKGPEVERAWTAINTVMSQHSDENGNLRLVGYLRTTLTQLRDKARMAKQKAEVEAEEKEGMQIKQLRERNFLQFNPNSMDNNNALSNYDSCLEMLYNPVTAPANISDFSAQTHTHIPQISMTMPGLSNENISPLTVNNLQNMNSNWTHSVNEPLETPILDPMSTISNIMPHVTNEQMPGLPINGNRNENTNGIVNGIPDVNQNGNENVNGERIANKNWNNQPSSFNTNINNAGNIDDTLLLNDQMDWANWDDMIQQYAMQNEMNLDGSPTGMGYFNANSNFL